MPRLSRATLSTLGPAVARPAYDPGSLSPGIVHIGIGNFHRAHQAVYLDELFARGLDHGFGIVGAGVRDADRAMRDALSAQDYLSTVVEQEGDAAQARVVAAMVGFVDPADVGALVDTLADPRTRIVSLTITEGGYSVDTSSGAPTAFAPIVAALARRRAAGQDAFTVMSCDNLPGNGDAARAAVVGLAAQGPPGLAEWIDRHASFPNAMVDRITPAATDVQRSQLRSRFGLDDARPVFCEAFRQWVLEDRFSAGRPRLEEVGVRFVDDVHPFERMKIRILNGGHAAIAYPAALMDITLVHEAMANPLLAAFLSKLLAEEVLPEVPPVPGVDLFDYKASVERRFANPAVGDTIRRLCQDGSNRQPKFIVPTIAARLAAGKRVEGLALVSAAWCRYCREVTDSGTPIQPNDDAWPRLSATAREAESDPRAWLAMHDVYGEVGMHPAFASAFDTALRELAREGAARALARYVG